VRIRASAAAWFVGNDLFDDHFGHQRAGAGFLGFVAKEREHRGAFAWAAKKILREVGGVPDRTTVLSLWSFAGRRLTHNSNTILGQKTLGADNADEQDR
jgi:hypothetical protein